jgi:hypothetical protein
MGDKPMTLFGYPVVTVESLAPADFGLAQPAKGPVRRSDTIDFGIGDFGHIVIVSNGQIIYDGKIPNVTDRAAK